MQCVVILYFLCFLEQDTYLVGKNEKNLWECIKINPKRVFLSVKKFSEIAVIFPYY